MENRGFTYDDVNPSIYILNTCAVTARAERKCLTKIHALAKSHPDSAIVIMGCFSQLSYSKFKGMEQVRIVVGTQGRGEIPGHIEKAMSDDSYRYFSIEKNTRNFYYEPLDISDFYTESRAYVKIQDGCDGFCTFCVIPFVRGQSRCRDRVSILREAQNLSRNGIHEIVITGIDADCYKDPQHEEYDFVDLLKDMDDVLDGTCRIRISSIEPSRVSDRLLDILKNSKSIVPHIHLPLQSGSDKILKAMRRRYDSSLYLDTVKRIREAIPSIALSTDVIVGFPSETEQDFQDTYNLCKQIGFMKIHVFPYSSRPFTPAGKMKGQVNGTERHDRAKRLIALSDQMSREYRKSITGQARIVLFESKNREGYWQGYTEDYVPYRMKSTDDLKNKFVEVTM